MTRDEEAASDPTPVRDPVCGMTVDRATVEWTATHKGGRYYFCASRCQEKFEADPDQFLGERRTPEPMPEGTLYTCPMHPEIIEDALVDCPKCGMALEPMGIPPRDSGPNPELVDFSFRFKVGFALTIPLLIVAMGPMLGVPLREWLGGAAAWVELLLATPVVIWCAAPFFKRA